MPNRSKTQISVTATNAALTYAKIFPPLGIARVGDSQDEFFIGPEASTVPSQRESERDAFRFRDATGRIKRQAARFRVFGFDAKGNFVREITSKEAKITWKARLANRKAEWFRFTGTTSALAAFAGEREAVAREFRNPSLGALKKKKGPVGARYQPDATRTKAGLAILPPEVAIEGVSQVTKAGVAASQFEFNSTFKNKKKVYLGELRTDEAGRLLVLGGRGNSDAVDATGASIRDLSWIQNYANTDDWHDDTSDGYVRAEVILTDSGRNLKVHGGAWVIVTPPDFAPDTANIVTLQDVMEEVIVDNPALLPKELPAPANPNKPDFDRDIRPIFTRLDGYKWVNNLGLRGHGFQKPGDFNSMLDGILANPKNPDGARARQHIFSLIRAPIYLRPGKDKVEPEKKPAVWARALAQANATFMPPLSGDEGNRVANQPHTWLTVTHLQYQRLKQWACGNFEAGAAVKAAAAGTGAKPAAKPPVSTAYDFTVTPLAACCGGAFYPGIELTCITRHPALYAEAFRVNDSVFTPGDLTKYMACPWQADFYECMDVWWPAQRPDDVVTKEDFDEIVSSFDEETKGDFEGKFEKVLFNRKKWGRGLEQPRPTTDFLRSQLLPQPGDATFEAYNKGRTSFIVDFAFGRNSPISNFTAVADDPANYPKFPDRLPSPWRLQYLAQEFFDQYSGRYFHLIAPDPSTVAIANLRPTVKALPPQPPGSLQSLWPTFRVAHEAEARKIVETYAKAVSAAVAKQVAEALKTHAAQFTQMSDFYKDLTGSLDDGVEGVEDANPLAFDQSSPVFFKLRVMDMLMLSLDLLYLYHRERAGDVGMVDKWRDMGFVAHETMVVTDRAGKPNTVSVYVEKERPRYDGLSYRDYWHCLLNPEKFPSIIPYSKTLAELFLVKAEGFMDKMGLLDQTHPESFVSFTQTKYDAKLEEIYEGLRQKAAAVKPWRSRTNRADAIAKIIGNAPFNQGDGAWLRYAANAGPTAEVRELLFGVWSDETGNGDAAKHHGNLYTALLNELGFFPPPINSRDYADLPELSESTFVSPVFELAISQNSEDYLPELLGMTLFLEWEVLSLVPGIKLYDYLGINSHFWQMHVGIDNATEGHGFMAKRAVRLYLDGILREGGDQAMQSQWRRIWRGFVAFALNDYSVYTNKDQSDAALDRKYPGTSADRITGIMLRKRHYGSLNHSNKRMGGFRINDLFDDPDTFMEELSRSSWITPGKPEESGLIKHLTSFDGPMYKIFDAADMQSWKDWIQWLGKEGDTSTVKRFIGKAEAMFILLSELREQAMAVTSHTRYKLEVPHAGHQAGQTPGKKQSIAALFSQPDLKVMMRALRDPANGWIQPFDPDQSPLVLDMAQANRPMGKALDQRFPAISNQIGRRVLVEWILAGCPIPGEPLPQAGKPKSPTGPRVRLLLVEEYGMGAVH